MIIGDDYASNDKVPCYQIQPQRVEGLSFD